MACFGPTSQRCVTAYLLAVASPLQSLTRGRRSLVAAPQSTAGTIRTIVQPASPQRLFCCAGSQKMLDAVLALDWLPTTRTWLAAIVSQACGHRGNDMQRADTHPKTSYAPDSVAGPSTICSACICIDDIIEKDSLIRKYSLPSMI